jgi:hypothetical protein
LVPVSDENCPAVRTQHLAGQRPAGRVGVLRLVDEDPVVARGRRARRVEGGGVGAAV